MSKTTNSDNKGPSLRDLTNAHLAEVGLDGAALIAAKLPEHLRSNLIKASQGNAVLPSASMMRITGVVCPNGDEMGRNHAGELVVTKQGKPNDRTNSY